MVGAQNLQVAQLIPHAQHVVCLKLVAVAGAADTLKVFAAVWIPCPQSPNESCRNDVVHVAPSPGLREIYFAKLHFASSSKCRDSMIFPTPARWALARPLPVHAFPAYRFLLRSETRLAELASPVTVRFATSIHCLENLCSLISAIWTAHGHNPPFVGSSTQAQTRITVEGGLKSRILESGEAQTSHRKRKICRLKRQSETGEMGTIHVCGEQWYKSQV